MRAIERDVLGLALVVELLAHAARRSPWRSRVVSIAGSMRRWIANSHSSCCRSASTADCMSGYCSLQASGSPSMRRGAMHLAERGGRRRLVLEARRTCFCQSAPSSAIMRRLTNGQPIGGASLCSLASSSAYSGGSSVGDGRHQLGDLHDRALQPAERRGQLGGVAGAVALAAEQPRAGDARRHAADIGADPGIARGAGGEAVRSSVVGRAMVVHMGRRCRAMSMRGAGAARAVRLQADCRGSSARGLPRSPRRRRAQG